MWIAGLRSLEVLRRTSAIILATYVNTTGWLMFAVTAVGKLKGRLLNLSEVGICMNVQTVAGIKTQN